MKMELVLICSILTLSLTACSSSNETEETQIATQTETESESAIDAAKAYLDKGKNLNRGDMIAHLEMEGFSEDEAADAAENCGADWKELALDTANSFISGPISYSEDEIRETLEEYEFTNDEIDYAMENADWSLQTEEMT